MSRYFEWYPPAGGTPLTIGASNDMLGTTPYLLESSDGLMGTGSDLQMQKAPFQVGESLIDMTVNPRRIGLSVNILADNRAQLFQRRAAVSRAFVALPTPPGNARTTGLLRYYRGEGMDPLEIVAMPASSPTETNFPTHTSVDIELVCPYPFWRTIADITVPMSGTGGFSFDATHIQFPLEMLAGDATVIIDNVGDVPTPILARLYGTATVMRLQNLTTGEEIEITGTVTSPDYVEINTEFGLKSVYLVSSGVRTKIMDRITLPADFFNLVPGNNEIHFEANAMLSAIGSIFYRPRYAGV